MIQSVECNQKTVSYRFSQKVTNLDECHGLHVTFVAYECRLPYSNTVGASLDASMTVRSQQSAIGKALWHQVTTVVILRQNMCQNTQLSKDACFRTALENMRYAQCTQDDIEFLKTRITGKNPGQPNISKK